ILQGNCLDILKDLPSQSVDFIFADPPYFMQTQGELLRVGGARFEGVQETWDQFKDFAHYDDFSCLWLAQCRRLLKNRGSICVIGSFQNIYRLGYLMQNLGFWIINDIIWHKTNPVPNFTGSRLCNAHEIILWCAKDKKASFTFNYKTLKSLNQNKQEKSVWFIP
ncbi:DNA-methyltransferase, partial [Helicobacter suis]